MADPNCAPMYANRSRRTKTDKRERKIDLDTFARRNGRWQALATGVVGRPGD